MRYHLDPLRPFGRHQIAMITRQITRAHPGRSHAAGQGVKEPAFVVIKTGAMVQALDMTGAVVAPSDVLALCPEAAILLTPA